MTEWLRALRALFALTPAGDTNPFARRRDHHFWSRTKFARKPSPQDGLTFAEVVEWLDLSKPMRRPKRVRAVLLEATTLGMIRVENGRYFATELLFYGGPDKDKLIDPRPLVRRRADECGSCCGHLSERNGCWLCEGCGLRIDKPWVRFICRQCGKFRRGHAWSGTGKIIGDTCSVGRSLGRIEHCEANGPTTEMPQKAPETIGSYETGVDALDNETFMRCPHCRGSRAVEYVRPDEAGLVWCDSVVCGSPFYLPDTEPFS